MFGITLYGLYNIKLFNNDQKVYDENLPFCHKLPNDKDITDFIKLIKPFLIFNKIEYEFLKEYNDK